MTRGRDCWRTPGGSRSQARFAAVAFAIVSAALAIVVVVGRLTLTFIGDMPMPFTEVNASMDTSAILLGTDIHVVGTTDLFDGAVIDYDVWLVGGQDLTHDVGGRTVVRGGQFGYDADVSGWPAGCVRIRTRFNVDTDGQPAEAVDRFGQSGSRLSGPDVYNDSGTRVLDNMLTVQCP